MRDITDSIEARAGSTANQTSAQTPIVTVTATVKDDIGHTEAQRVVGTLRREIVNKTSFAEGANSDHTVDTFAIETITAVGIDDFREIANSLERALGNEGYIVDGMAVQAEIKTSTF